ncbi:MAG: hypothetical protein FWB91_02095 [Defluviitaleaceae bacterium]|nr:hypothetical protein [Defluviitaleaceae bacterium]
MRLIDADKLIDVMRETSLAYYEMRGYRVEDMIDRAPTITRAAELLEVETAAKNDAIENLSLNIKAAFESRDHWRAREKALEVAVKSDLINYGKDFYPPVCRACIHHGSEQKHLTCGPLCGDEYKNWQFDQDRFTNGGA